jgi:spore germination cell wall hydrolase CwlJ-like protein
LTARPDAPIEGAALSLALDDDPSTGRSSAFIDFARLDDGGPFNIHEPSDEREPHRDLKPNAGVFPEIDRTNRADPMVSLRPSLEGRRNGETRKVDLRAPQGVEQQGTSQKSAAPTSTGQTASAAATPAQLAAPLGATERVAHGATPQTSRAVALGSSTPAQPDSLPIEVASFPRATFALQGGAQAGALRPDYASMIEPERMDGEKRCLAEAVYFEARSEPVEGQAAVAQVVLNRVSSGLYPASVCGVVYQNRNRYKRCQFSFACEGKSLRVTERDAWLSAVRVAEEVLAGRTYLSEVGRATHYHATYVKPRWARQLTKMDAIGKHIFYKLKPGQT